MAGSAARFPQLLPQAGSITPYLSPCRGYELFLSDFILNSQVLSEKDMEVLDPGTTAVNIRAGGSITPESMRQ